MTTNTADRPSSVPPPPRPLWEEKGGTIEEVWIDHFDDNDTGEERDR